MLQKSQFFPDRLAPWASVCISIILCSQALGGQNLVEREDSTIVRCPDAACVKAQSHLHRLQCVTQVSEPSPPLHGETLRLHRKELVQSRESQTAIAVATQSPASSASNSVSPQRSHVRITKGNLKICNCGFHALPCWDSQVCPGGLSEGPCENKCSDKPGKHGSGLSFTGWRESRQGQ